MIESKIAKSASLPMVTPFYYGWLIVFMGALGLFFSGPGQTYFISVFIDQYIQDFGWSRSLVSSTYSIATICAGLLLFLIGRSIDHFGYRTVSVITASLLAFACFWNGFMVNTIMLFIGIFLLRLLGQGSMALVHNSLVPQWFIKQRGRALSFLAIGGVFRSCSHTSY